MKYAHEIHVEALRLEGEFLEREPKDKGGRPKTSSPKAEVSNQKSGVNAQGIPRILQVQ
jgi:hypothetical protein